MENIINGKEIAADIKLNLKKEVDELKNAGINPKLAIVLVGDDKASQVYVKNKNKACQEVGIDYEEYLLPKTTKQEELLELIYNLNNDERVHGILVQSPLPKQINADIIFEAILPIKDVDGFNSINAGKLFQNKDCFTSCTPFGIIKILEKSRVEIEGANAVIIGRSNVVGKPLAAALLNKNATVTICHSKTKNLKEITSKADILIAAIGKSKFVTEDMVKEGAVVIDVGINRQEDGKLLGDVDFENVKNKASLITPVPGGVGPMTIAMLMYNVVKAAKQQ